MRNGNYLNPSNEVDVGGIRQYDSGFAQIINKEHSFSKNSDNTVGKPPENIFRI